MANTAPTPKAVALVLVPALVLMLAFAFFYVGAFHDPLPHHVPLAVVGPPAVAVQLSRSPGDPLAARQASSRADALSQIDDREVYGAYEAATNRLFVASAANRATAIALEQTFAHVAAAQHRPAVNVTPPPLASRERLTVDFDRPLDRALLEHSLTVAADDGTEIPGRAEIAQLSGPRVAPSFQRRYRAIARLGGRRPRGVPSVKCIMLLQGA
jgi:hypothetical protein